MRCLSIPVVTAGLAALTAAAAGRGHASSPDADRAAQPIELPPMFVEGFNRTGPQWVYGTVPGFEILSCCTDETTVRFVEQMQRSREALGQLVPAALRLGTSVPSTFILFSKDFEKSMAAEVLAVMERSGTRDSAGGDLRRARHLPQLWLADPDSSMMYFILDDHGGDEPPDRLSMDWGPGRAAIDGYSSLSISPDYVFFLLAGRVPHLPAWFVDGMAVTYAATAVVDDVVTIGRAGWGGEEEALKRDPPRPRNLLPSSALFGSAPAPAPGDPASEARFRNWVAQSALFVRWCLDGRGQPRRAALWELAAGATIQPVTEARFRALFGIGFSDLRDRLSDYLPAAVSRVISWRFDRTFSIPEPTMRAVTPAELHRIRGEWERREIGFIRPRYPLLAPHYEEEAERTLIRDYQDGDRDARLLDSLGLLYRSTGDDVRARRFLEAAYRAGGLRPVAALELARLRFSASMANPAGRAGKLSAPQAAAVLEALEPAFSQSPPLLGSYALTADVWRHEAPQPSDEELRALDQGARFFPDSGALAITAALAEVAAGDRREAAALIDLGLINSRNPDARRRLEGARARIVRPPAGPRPSP